MAEFKRFKCDGPDDCQITWAKGAPGFLHVTETGDGTGPVPGDRQLDFCGWDCAIRYGAQFPPVEEIPVSGESDDGGERDA